MEQINDLLHGVGTRLEKVENRGKTEPPFRQAPVPVSKKLGDIMTATMAAALTRLVVEEETARMRICKGEDCEAAIIDLTRNRSKLFCDFGNCANRAHVRAYRARQAAVRNGRRPAAATPQAPQEDLPREPKLNKPSSAEKAAAIEQPTSESAVAAKEFRDQMRTELMDARAETGKKSKKKKRSRPEALLSVPSVGGSPCSRRASSCFRRRSFSRRCATCWRYSSSAFWFTPEPWLSSSGFSRDAS
ncbi:CGNR zinc finger domain-containing protein [Nesterenkonia pannonica]|uniref:CGNR zinc finger domain-containing protein n=1 Tax=Nesterenkonia pannonica TaxID=1548602 RepID=UPI0021642F52|nr:CGNR zinc finger domain-containing protein [Nesterenkonia pannonica]